MHLVQIYYEQTKAKKVQNKTMNMISPRRANYLY
jgi:hypothetical protein